MSQSVFVDTKQLRNIVVANTAIASSMMNLYDLAEKLGEKAVADQLRAELDKVVAEARKIQNSVRIVIDENQ